MFNKYGILGENLLAVPPVNKTVMEGEIVDFQCVTKDPNMIMTWLRDGIEIPELEVEIKIIKLLDIKIR